MPGLRDILQKQNAYKSYESEGFLDVYFYRPAGALFALIGKHAGLTPNILTTASLLTGVAGAALLYRNTWMWHGLGLLVLSGVLDASDGQLARMTGSSSLMGRMLDGAADYLVFIATYLALGLKYAAMRPDASPVPIFALAAAAGVSHSVQASLFDYYRSEYGEYVDKRRIPGPDMDSQEARAAARSNPLTRFLAWSHRDYTRRQRRFAAGHVLLGDTLRALKADGKLTPSDSAAYREHNLPLIGLWNLLGSNSRLLLIAAALAVGRPELYFWAEVTAYNILAAAAHRGQVRADNALLDLLQKG